jgi:hypothetical protein
MPISCTSGETIPMAYTGTTTDTTTTSSGINHQYLSLDSDGDYVYVLPNGSEIQLDKNTTGPYAEQWNEYVRSVVRQMMGIDGSVPVEDLVKLYKKFPKAMNDAIKLMKEAEKDG